MSDPEEDTSGIDRVLANRWMGAPVRVALPFPALGEVHLAHHLPVLDQDSKYVGVAFLAIASRASHRDPALPFREARREARVQVLLICIPVGELVQARAIRVHPVEVGGPTR